MLKRQLPYTLIIILLTAAAASAQVTFTDVTGAVGLGHFTEGDLFISATWADYDNDGDADLLLFDGELDFVSAGGTAILGLYRNDGDEGFFNVTQSAGISDISTTGGSAIFMDSDNDGDLDLFTGGGYPLVGPFSSYPRSGDFLYRNNGDGTFTDISESAGMDDTTPLSANGASFDYDNDGLLDIYIAHWAIWSAPMEIGGPYPNSLYHENHHSDDTAGQARA